MKELLQQAETKMKRSCEALKNNLGKLRTGRAHPGLLDHIMVNCYGSDMPLPQVASVSASDARTLTVTPWDKNMLASVEKAIRTSDLGLNPNNSGTTIRVPLPPLTEERRRELVKVVKQEGESSKVAIRNIRRETNDEFKKLLKDKLISEDEEKRAQDSIQKLTDKYIAEVEQTLAQKEKEMMEI